MGRRYEVPVGTDEKILNLILDLDTLDERYRAWKGRHGDKSLRATQEMIDGEIVDLSSKADKRIDALEREIAGIVRKTTRQINDRRRFLTRRAQYRNAADEAEERHEQARVQRKRKATTPVLLVLLDSCVQGGLMSPEQRDQAIGEGWDMARVNRWIAGER